VRKSPIYSDYAQFYDAIYRDKDYRSEVEFLFGELKTNGLPLNATALDIGSGSGRHLEAMQWMKINGTGIEPSAQMVREARARGVSVQQGYLEDLKSVRKFDVCTAFFAVANHVAPPALGHFFEAAKSRLHDQGLFAIEIWAPGSKDPRPTSKAFTYLEKEYIRTIAPSRTGANSWLLSISIIESGSREVIAREEHTLYKHPLERLAQASEKFNFQILSAEPLHLNPRDLFHETYLLRFLG